MLGPLLLEKSACRDIKHWSTAHKQKINQRKRMNFKKHRHTCTFEWTKLNEKMAFKSYAWQGGFHQCYTIRCSELTEWVKNIQRQRFVSNQRPGLHVVLGQIKDDSLKKKQLSCSWKLSYCPLGCWANFLSPTYALLNTYGWMLASKLPLHLACYYHFKQRPARTARTESMTIRILLIMRWRWICHVIRHHH